MIKGILFDFYGTLVEEDDILIEKLCNKIFDESEKVKTLEDISSYWIDQFSKGIKNSNNNYFKLQRDIELQSIKNTVTFCKSTASENKIYEILISYWKNPKLFANTKNVLNLINLPTCLVSNIDNQELKFALKNSQIKSSYIVTSEDCRSYKPNPLMFEKALELLNLKSNEVIHVGDSFSSDVIGAKNLGIKVVWINSKNKDISNFNIEPDFEISEIGELPKILESAENIS